VRALSSAILFDEAEEVLRRLDDLRAIQARQQPPDPALNSLLDIVRDLVQQNDELMQLRRLVRRAEAAYERNHDPRELVRILMPNVRVGRPAIDHRAALDLYVSLRRPGIVLHRGPEDRLPKQSVLEAVRDAFGYKSLTWTQDALSKVRQTARRDLKKLKRDETPPMGLEAAANADLPGPDEVMS
jgi:hypothetical protein